MAHKLLWPQTNQVLNLQEDVEESFFAIRVSTQLDNLGHNILHDHNKEQEWSPSTPKRAREDSEDETDSKIRS